jgi:hypothetical protein
MFWDNKIKDYIQNGEPVKVSSISRLIRWSRGKWLAKDKWYGFTYIVRVSTWNRILDVNIIMTITKLLHTSHIIM